jgi:SAM-dependent methyltransferase
MKFKYYPIVLFSYLRRKKKRSLIRLSFSLKGEKGLEIGGPSAIFGVKGGIPVYIFASQVDNANYSGLTLREGVITKGYTFNYLPEKNGYQYIAEATNLAEVADENYGFVLSSHSLEHVANPIKAIYEWKRVLKPQGKLILILPEKENTFDHKRPFTSFEHLLADFNNNIGEDDGTHFPEALQLHDFERDPNKESFKDNVSKNIATRIVHHHVFSFEVIKKMLEYCGFELEYQQQLPPFNLITIAKKR